MANKKEVPTGVKIISVLYYIGAAVCVLLGIALIAGGGLFGSMLDEVLGGFLGGIIIVVGIFAIALGVLNFFVAKGLWKGKNWARIVVIIFSILGAVSAINSLFRAGNMVGDLFSLAIDVVIGGYLLLNEEVKKVFA